MKPLLQRVGLCLVIVALLAAVIVLMRSSEPRARGRSLSSWVNSLPGTGTAPRAAAAALREIGTNAIPPLLQLLRTKDSPEISKLNELLRKQSLIRFHFREASEKRAKAVAGFNALGSIAKPAIPELVELFNDPESALPALRALNEIGPDAVLPLTQALSHTNSEVRDLAADLLSRHGAAHPKIAVPALLQAMRDPDEFVRSTAAKSLCRIEHDPGKVIPALIARLEDPSRVVGVAVAECLGEFGAEAKSAVPALVKRIERNPGELLSIIPALAKIQPDTAMTSLSHLLRETNMLVRLRAAYQIRSLRDQLKGSSRAATEMVISTLIQMLEAPEPEVRGVAAWTLGEFGSEARMAIPALQAAFEKEEGWKPRAVLASAITSIDPDSATNTALNRFLPPERRGGNR